MMSRRLSYFAHFVRESQCFDEIRKRENTLQTLNTINFHNMPLLNLWHKLSHLGLSNRRLTLATCNTNHLRQLLHLCVTHLSFQIKKQPHDNLPYFTRAWNAIMNAKYCHV